MENVELLVKNGEVWTPGGFVDADIAVSGGKIIALGKPPVLPETATDQPNCSSTAGEGLLIVAAGVVGVPDARL